MKKCAIVCCSDGRTETEHDSIELLKNKLICLDLECTKSKYIFKTENSCNSASPRERASVLNDLFRKNTDFIFDISGGNTSNELLPYLDYNAIGASSSVLWGYSDMTTIINAVYTIVGKASVFFQIKNIVGKSSFLQTERFSRFLNKSDNSLFDIDYKMISGNKMQGIVVGGNIRCFLKLAGTRYFPDLSGKLLLIEGFHTDEAELRTYLNQLYQLRAFDKLNGVIIGNFTKLDNSDRSSLASMLLYELISDRLPVAKTFDIGHAHDSKAIVIGKELSLHS